MVAIVTMCEAYMRIEPHFNLWNHFFRARLLYGSGAEAEVLGSVDLYVRSGNGVDPYFHLPMSGPSNWVVENMVLSQDQRRRVTPQVHG
jgi:hypothetical protein